MIIPFINVRWGDIVYPYESLQVATQNWIQDIYNEYRWSWQLNTRKIETTDWTDSNWYYSLDLGNVKWIEAFEVVWDLYTAEYEVVKKLTDLWDNKVLFHGTYVICATAVEASVTYLEDHTWNLFMSDTSVEIPLPERFIPALYYLVLSQIDIIEVTQAENQTYANYWKYTNKIKTLKENDLPTAIGLVWGTRA